MTQEPYTKREIDAYHSNMEENMKELKDEMTKGFKTTHTKLDYTNGKVRKIIIALISVVFFSVGLGLKELSPLLKLLL